jgi:hypothetical protein
VGQVSAPLVRYDGATHSARLQALEDAIRGRTWTNLESVILWINQFFVDEVGYRRRMACGILGTARGCAGLREEVREHACFRDSRSGSGGQTEFNA